MVSTANGVDTLTVDGVRRTEMTNFAPVEALTIQNCSSSGGETCTPATLLSFFNWNSGDTVGSWLKVYFATEVTIKKFGWYNRGNPRNIRGMTLEFSDGSTQAFTLAKRSTPVDSYKRGHLGDHCMGVSWQTKPYDFKSCTQKMNETTTSWVKLTNDDDWDVMWAGTMRTGFGHQGTSKLIFYGYSAASLAALQENGGYKICSMQEVEAGAAALLDQPEAPKGGCREATWVDLGSIL